MIFINQLQDDGDNVSLRSVTINKEDAKESDESDDDDDADSVKTLTGVETHDKETREDVTQAVVYNVNDDAEDDIEIHPDDADDEVELDEYKPATEKAEDSVSIKSYSIHGAVSRDWFD